MPDPEGRPTAPGLDEQYDARASVEDSERYLQRRREWSGDARVRLRPTIDLAYGPNERNTLDLFLPEAGASPSPLVAYLHGGYWRANSKEDSAFVAPALVGRGVAVAVVEYPLLPSVTMDRLVSDVRGSIEWLARNAARWRIDPGRLVVAGHSSGAHLAAMAAASGWAERRGLPSDLVKGACLLSGLYDLEPIRRTFVNEWARLDPESARRNSPAEHLPGIAARVIVAYGTAETGEFQRQSRAYAEACAAAGIATRVHPLDGRHHYATPEELHRADSPLIRDLIRLASEGAGTTA